MKQRVARQINLPPLDHTKRLIRSRWDSDSITHLIYPLAIRNEQLLIMSRGVLSAYQQPVFVIQSVSRSLCRRPIVHYAINLRGSCLRNRAAHRAPNELFHPLFIDQFTSWSLRRELLAWVAKEPLWLTVLRLRLLDGSCFILRLNRETVQIGGRFASLNEDLRLSFAQSRVH